MGRPPVRVHAGGCWDARKRCTGISTDEARRALADGVQACPHCRSEDQVIVTGYKATRHRKLTTGQKQANRIPAAGRAPVEHGFAHLKNWRILTKLRTNPARATALLRSLLVLTDLESSR
ncbi:hypothetical protein OV450_3534 [Actinobacteria bacterium OV450]|nr:hypothetical protein OV450_3534 [Actinobacteria bacterium OV450]